MSGEQLAFEKTGKVETPKGQVVLLESMTLDAFRAWRKVEGVIVLTGCGYELRLDTRCYLPDLKNALDGFLLNLMTQELRLFEE